MLALIHFGISNERSNMTRDGRIEEIVEAAIAARQFAYAPYSQFAVGAALLDEQGALHTGCNVENGSFGLTVCAERVAVQNAVSLGQRKFSILAIATQGGHAPCGACRQVISEFVPDLRILLIDVAQAAEFVETTLSHLLPNRFDFAGVRGG